MKLRTSCIQLSSTDDRQANIAAARELIARAAIEGARLIALPENAFLMATGERFHTQVFRETEDEALQAMRDTAAEYAVHLLIGSLHIRPPSPPSSCGSQSENAGSREAATDPASPLRAAQDDTNENPTKYRNRSYLIGPDGDILARYDKLHLFDVSFSSGESHKESDRFTAGDCAVLVKTDLATIGLSICYDVRFPELYDVLAKAGAQIITVPAAFTFYTGDLGHWHTLLKARAIETGCFIIAPAQCGRHPGDRHTYGHSLIIDPTGQVLADGSPDTPGIVTADLDLTLVDKARESLPNLQHHRPFELIGA